MSKDPLAEQGLLRTSSKWQPQSKHGDPEHPPTGFQIWSGALRSGRVAAVLANLDTTTQRISMHASELPPRSRQSDDVGATTKWDITEAFSGKVQCRGCELPVSVSVGPHDVAFWTMAPAKL